MSAWSVLAKGGFSSGGFSSRVGSSSRIGSYSSRTGGGFSSTRPKTGSTSRLGGTTSRPRTSTTRSTVVQHVTTYRTTRVYGGRTYSFHSGGWGYGYYGPHVYIDSWYGYPLYYGNPGHWSGWDWAWAPLVALGVIAAAFFVVALVVSWFVDA